MHIYSPFFFFTSRLLSFCGGDLKYEKSHRMEICSKGDRATGGGSGGLDAETTSAVFTFFGDAGLEIGKAKQTGPANNHE